MVLNFTKRRGLTPALSFQACVEGSAMAVTAKECLELQLLEVEMLLSMFPKRGEFSLHEDAVPSIQRYLRNAEGALPPQLEYRIALDVGEAKVRAAKETCSWVLLSLLLLHTLENSARKKGSKKATSFLFAF